MKYFKWFVMGWMLVVLGWATPSESESFAQTASMDEAHEIADALDLNGNGILDDNEIREAIRLWVTGSTVSGTGLNIDDILIRELVRMWVTGTPIQSQEEAFQTLDEKFADIAARLPGFGGMFMGDNDVLFVYMRDLNSATLQEIETAIAAEFSADRIPSGGIQILQADYGFTELKNWHDRHSEVTLKLPGVVFVDISESLNRLKIGISAMSFQTNVLNTLNQQGVPDEAVEFVEVAPFDISSGHSLQNRQRPLLGGIEISPNGGLCTLGWLAVLNGVAGFVTNSHCTATRGMVDGSMYFQMDSTDPADFIGTEEADPPQYTGNGCPSGRQCRLSDSAFIRLTPGNDPGVSLEASFGRIALPLNENGGMNVDTTIRITGETPNIVEGDIVHKVGRTTGHTSGEVIDTCVSSNSFQNGVDTGITMICQYRVEASSGPGDSGSPVFAIRPSALTNVGAVAELYGILWGGNGTEFAFSPIFNIEFELGPVRSYPLDSGDNSPPVVQIIKPANGGSVGFGSLAIETFEVTVVDFEDGSQCCTVKWTSDVDGEMGGGKTLEYAFSSGGPRTITATATDQDGVSASHSITVIAGANTKPTVEIDQPANFHSSQVGNPVVFEGTSFDPNEPFQTLACNKLTWTSNVPGDPFPVTGCDIAVTFNTPGERKIKLTGVDSQGESDTDEITIFIIVPGPNAPPQVTILSPNDNTLLNANQVAQLRASANDPDDKNPIAYKWSVEVFGNKTEIVSGTMNDGQQITTPWTPSSHVPGNCGTQNAVLIFEATDADGMSNSKSVNIQVLFGAC